MAASQPSLNSNAWIYSIRTSMVNDPARQWFDTQVQSHGFEFLDDYLGNILAQAKPQPIIELVKTPSRKKNTTKKTKSATTTSSKLKSVISLSLEDDDDQFKENVAPVKTIHQALLDAGHKNDTANPEFEREIQHIPLGVSSKREAKDVSYLGVDELEQLENLGEVFDYPRPNSSEEGSLKLPAASLESKDLSVIAEGDESADQNRRSAHFTAPSLPTEQLSRPSPVPTQLDLGMQTHLLDNDITSTMALTILSSMHSSRPIVPEDSKAHADCQRKSSGNHTPAIIATNLFAAVDTHSMTAPLSSLQPPARTPSATFKTTIPLHEIPGTGLMRKTSAPQLQAFPTVLNSTRDPSSSSVPQVVLPKRTSWLVKAKEAREAKVVEVSTKRISSFGQGGISTDQTSLIVPSGSGQSKRKSSEMLDAVETEGPTARQSKVLKVVEDDVQSNALWDHLPPATEIRSTLVSEDDTNVDMSDYIKRTKEGPGARKGKSIGKSLGGTAAVALAEARATAEARVAEKAKMEAGLQSPVLPNEELEEVPPATRDNEPTSTKLASTRSRDSDKRLSVSELFVNCESVKGKERVFQPPVAGTSRNSSDIGTNVNTADNNSTVPDPISSPKSHQSKPSLSLLSKPVFMKPPPKVFVPPPKPKSTSQKMIAMNVGLSPSLQKVAPLSSQSSAASLKSDVVFDHDNAPPAWMSTTQDTEYPSAIDYETATQDQEMRCVNEMEDDDSWHDGDKLGELNHIWTSLAFEPTEKEDEMTWSTIPTQTHTSSTQNQSNSNKLHNSQANPATTDTNPKGNGTTNLDMTRGNVPEPPEGDIADYDMDIDESELEDLELAPGQMTVGLVKKQVDSDARSSLSQQSIASSESSQGGIFHQASKFVTSVLGTSKKGQTPDPVKSIQLAAAVARKQKGEEDKKATRMKEMEIRRQHVAQKKMEEEKSRALEEEKKAKEDADKRKREREELTDKKPLKASTAKKVNDEPSKKPKAVGAGSSQENKEAQPARVTRAATNNPPKSILKPSAETPPIVQAVPKPATVIATEPKSSKSIIIATPAKGKGKAVAADQDDPQPSRIVQGHMAARARAQLHPAPPVQSESIQLPEIDSEYSDSDDEDRKKNFDPPEWAQSPNLHNALHTLSTLNPDNIFGAVQPLHIEDMFKSRHSRFRARTSSANWTGNDGLTAEEEAEYARRMGFNN